CGVTSLAGCGSQSDGPSSRSPESQESVGSVGLELQVAAGATINSASYTITGPNGFSKTGTIDVSATTKLTATIGGLPAGAGYSITLSATSTDGSTGCTGSGAFTVVARQTATVTVAVACHEAARTGS